ncbi:hypothetical protein [Chitinophaga japonensis]|uniref:Uncharacterized protein n=1 Tax=Chitinophaga japonensis TaxID=104662 RepID=A0A562T1A0_CHIJA|nr:hypothetical protein [Chitinophaga japonensis]TWI86776.1 hypothetical protein LX66_4040 [Chitinophaga japonensis]
MYRTLFILLLASASAAAQTTVPFSSSRWKISGKEAVQETHLGQPALRLKEASALLEDADFQDGIIEFDIALEKDRYFPGIDFRMQDERNFEEYYLRPHQSGNPDAQQYTPVNNRQAGWQLYYGPGFNGAVTLPFDRWLHIKMLVSGRQAEIYFDHADTPVLSVYPLKREVTSGMIALSNPWPANAWYSNFAYTKTGKVPLKNKPAPAPPLPAGAIRSWQVSTPFPEKQVNDHHWLGVADTAALQWQELPADATGLADLSQVAVVSESGNTVFARKVLYAEQAGIKKLSFGFSDRARVYLNGRLLYAGADNFMSRDYRFLGTVGYFDAVYLDLQKGRNELWIAVSENFGGWGIKAKLE